jgi:hypothetical protein
MPAVGADPTVLGRTPAATRAPPEPPPGAFNQRTLVFERQVLDGSSAAGFASVPRDEARGRTPEAPNTNVSVTFRTTVTPRPASRLAVPDRTRPSGRCRRLFTEV